MYFPLSNVVLQKQFDKVVAGQHRQVAWRYNDFEHGFTHNNETPEKLIL